MRRFTLVLVLVAACRNEGSSGPEDRPPLPDICQNRCIADAEPASWEDCCDSVTCWFDDEAYEWKSVFCDPPLIDAAPDAADPCEACTADQLCVQRFDGTCGLATECVARTVECSQNACSPDCEQAYCPSPYQCQNRAPCGTESAAAFTCYGP